MESNEEPRELTVEELKEALRDDQGRYIYTFPRTVGYSHITDEAIGKNFVFLNGDVMGKIVEFVPPKEEVPSQKIGECTVVSYPGFFKVEMTEEQIQSLIDHEGVCPLIDGIEQDWTSPRAKKALEQMRSFEALSSK
jgi:hypothetical protein